MPAILEWLKCHADWKVCDFREDGAGLMVLRKNPDYAPEINMLFEEITKQLDKTNVKYFLIMSDELCYQTKIHVKCNGSMASTFVRNSLEQICRWVKMSLGLFDLRVLVLNKKQKTTLIDSDKMK